MNIRDEEQLQQYFERSMTSVEEQNFLINIAAREDMRLAFRSQLELLKAVREDKDASGSPTFVRSKTLGALGLGGALVPSSFTEQETHAASLPSTILEKIGTAFKRPAISIASGILAGVLGTSFFMQASTNQTHIPVSTTPVIQAPAIQAPPQNTAPVQQENRSHKSHRTYRISTPVPPNSEAGVAKNNESPVVTKTNPAKIETKTNIHKPEESGNK